MILKIVPVDSAQVAQNIQVVPVVIEILVYILIVLVIFTLYVHFRNDYVYEFRSKVNSLAHDSAIKILHDEGNTDKAMYVSSLYHKMPSYGWMMVIPKPLKLESYFNNEEIELLRLSE